MQSLNRKNHLRYAEYGLLVIIIGLTVLFLLHRMRTLQKEAERMRLAGEIDAMRAGVIAAIDKPPFDPNQIEHPRNPIHILQSPPKNYLGTIHNATYTDIPAKSWYFNPRLTVLIYKARFKHTLSFLDKPRQRIELRLEQDFHVHSNSSKATLACGPHVCLTLPQK